MPDTLAPGLVLNRDSPRGGLAPALAEQRFFRNLSWFLALLVLAGFAPSFYLRALFTAPPELTGLMQVHGLAFTTWILLLVTQTTLVARGHTRWHRRLGYAGIASALAMMGMAAALAYERTLTWLQDPTFSSGDVLAFLAVPSTTVVYFSGMFIAAFCYRKHPAIHKRLMMLATFDIITPAISRLPWMNLQGVFWPYAATDLLILILLVHDWRTLRRPHPATLLGGAVLVVSQAGREWLSTTDTWMDIAVRLTS